MVTKAIDDELAGCVKDIFSIEKYPLQNIRVEPDNIVHAAYHNIEKSILVELYFGSESELRAKERKHQSIPAVAALLKQINDRMRAESLGLWNRDESSQSK